MTSRFAAVALGIGVTLGLAGIAPAQQKSGSTPAQPEEKATPGATKADATQGKSIRAKAGATESRLETATFGGGCFWCLEAVFEMVPGVKSVVSGYAGGTVPNPSYQMVCTGLTGHAEVVQIAYDPEVVSYDQLLKVFWESHDPTTLNSQGPDVGTQYRSIILYHNEAQRQAARKSWQALTAARVYPSPIVTELVPLKWFYPAERYHQDYYREHPNEQYCRMLIAPKLRMMKIKAESSPPPR